MWTDAFKVNSTRVNINDLSSTKGSAAKHFGDAAVAFGKSMREVDNERVREKRIAADTALKDEQLAAVKKEATQKENDLAQQKVDKAFSKEYLAFNNRDKWAQSLAENNVDNSNVSPAAIAASKAYFTANEKAAQSKFNNEAIKVASTGSYGSMKDFVDDDKNKLLIQHADGDTMKKIDDYYSSKSTELGKIQTATKDLKVQAKINKLKAEKTLKDEQLAAVKKEATQKENDLAQQKVDKAFSKEYLAFNNRDKWAQSLAENNVDNSNVSPAAIAASKAYFTANEKAAQSKFNNEAIKVASTGSYGSMKDFVDDDKNKLLIQHADGDTMKKIDDYYSSKSTELGKIQTATKDLKVQDKINKLEAEKAKASSSKKDKPFKYTEATDAKIAAQVKTMLGLDDSMNVDFSDALSKKYRDTVAGSAEISKTYNLEPSLAIHAYTNPELYAPSADGKNLVKVKTSPPEEKAVETASWKTFQK